METKELTPEEKWEQATIANNFIFYKVMRDNPDVCKQLLEILLEIEIDRIEMNTQEVIDIDCQSKGVRLDVYAKNATQAFDIEVQRRGLCVSTRLRRLRLFFQPDIR